MQDFNQIQLGNTLTGMSELGVRPRCFINFSFGNIDQCREILKTAILSCDKTIVKFEFLREYELIAEWMTETKGKGLFLTGDVGRGKTNIIYYAIPLLFLHFQKKIVNRVHAEDLKNELSKLKKRKLIAIDDMGVEPVSNEYGVKTEPINSLFNIAENDSKILFISTNMNSEQVLERYGERTLDRIRRLCKVVPFKGESLRR